MAINVLNTLFLLAYLLSAAVQYNDPDASPWIAIYLAAAVMCVAQYRRKLPRWLPLPLLFTSLVWIGALVPGIAGQVSFTEILESISMQTRAVEEAREIGGLAFIALWAAVLLHLGGRERRATQPG